MEPPFADEDRRDTQEVFVLAGEEAHRLGETAISPQHLLVAILREGQGVAAMLLQISGVRWQQVGETVQISVTPGDEGKPIAVPVDVQQALQQHPAEQRVFEKMSSTKQRQLIDWVERAAGEAARKQQVEKVIDLLQQAHQNYQQSQGA